MTKLVSIIGLSVAINASISSNTQAADISDFIPTSEATPLTSKEKKVEMRILSYTEIADMAKDVITKLPANFEWKGIIALTRGGLVPAEIFAQQMNIRNIIALNVKSYDEKTQGAMEILNEKYLPDGGEGWLVIDDLSDTGKTAEKIRQLYPNSYIATLMVKPKGEKAVNLYSAYFKQDLWLHYPWESFPKEEEPARGEIPTLTAENTQALTYETVKDMTKDLMEKLPNRKWDGILALTQGGLTPAGIASQYMDIRRIEILNVEKEGQDSISDIQKIPNGGENWLVIGDFSTAENTAKAVRQAFPKAYITSLMAKPDNKASVDLFSTELPNDLNAQFPWDVKENTKDSGRNSAVAASVN